jgi:hypothetical protein
MANQYLRGTVHDERVNRRQVGKGRNQKEKILTMIRRWLLQVLEHGTVPAIVLALAIAPTNSSSWQRNDLGKPTKLRTDVLFSASTTGAMTMAPRDHKLAIAGGFDFAIGSDDDH